MEINEIQGNCMEVKERRIRKVRKRGEKRRGIKRQKEKLNYISTGRIFFPFHEYYTNQAYPLLLLQRHKRNKKKIEKLRGEERGRAASDDGIPMDFDVTVTPAGKTLSLGH